MLAAQIGQGQERSRSYDPFEHLREVTELYWCGLEP